MRERTPFPRALFAALPKLKLLITSGMRNASIDMEAAKDQQVVVCGTQWAPRSDRAADHGPDPGTDPQYRPRERPHACRRVFAEIVGIEIEGKTLGIVGLGKLGAKVAGARARRSA